MMMMKMMITSNNLVGCTLYSIFAVMIIAHPQIKKTMIKDEILIDNSASTYRYGISFKAGRLNKRKIIIVSISLVVCIYLMKTAQGSEDGKK